MPHGLVVRGPDRVERRGCDRCRAGHTKGSLRARCNARRSDMGRSGLRSISLSMPRCQPSSSMAIRLLSNRPCNRLVSFRRQNDVLIRGSVTGNTGSTSISRRSRSSLPVVMPYSLAKARPETCLVWKLRMLLASTSILVSPCRRRLDAIKRRISIL